MSAVLSWRWIYAWITGIHPSLLAELVYIATGYLDTAISRALRARLSTGSVSIGAETMFQEMESLRI